MKHYHAHPPKRTDVDADDQARARALYEYATRLTLAGGRLLAEKPNGDIVEVLVRDAKA